MKLTLILLTIYTIGLSQKGNIPKELIDVRGTYEYIECLDDTNHHHHDPSNIIKYNDLYYLYYTEHPRVTNGWEGYIRCATSKDGYKWEDKGIAIPRGKKGDIDDLAAITSYVVPYDGKFYLFYTAYGSKESELRGISYAIADTPDGPWKKSGKKLLWPSGNHDDWDGVHIDDANIIFYKNKWFLYYKGRPIKDGKKVSPNKTIIGVATSNNLTGPYKRYENNPVFEGHALTAYIHRDGVVGFGFKTFWSEDGFNFIKVSNWSSGTIGVYCPENFGNETNYKGVSWGMHVAKPKGKARHIDRVNLPLVIEE